MSECSHAYTERGNACFQCFTELEAEVERLEAQLKIAARDYAAVCDYPLAPSEALESWEYEALKVKE